MAVDENEILEILRRNGFTSGANPQNNGDTNTTQDQPFGVVSGGTGQQFGQVGNQIPPGSNPMQAYLEGIPGYQFARDEGINAILRGQAAKGVLRTGGTLRGITRYATGLADQTYGNQFDRVLSLADLGQRTAVAPF